MNLNSFDLPYNPKTTEKKIYKLWEKSGFFNPDKLPKRYKLKAKSYSVMMAPPNITGSLHMGHVLENTEVDILVRMKRMKGFKTLWLPGIDHAGIAAQNVVEKELRKKGLRRQDLGREKFEKKVKEWKEKYGRLILDQLKMLGISADWSRTRYTLDTDYTKAVAEAFSYYYKNGWIYRGERVINWCIRCGTSISDLEVNYVPEAAKLYFIKYGLFTLATTRPETKLGDTALAVHPNDKRYKKYVGKDLEIESIDNNLPLNQPAKIKKIKIRVVADKAVDPKFGTGIIKVTPAHDITDFEISKRHSLPSITIIDEHGQMNENAGLRYQGMKTAQAREQIVKDLEAIGLIEKIEDYDHNIARCDRCNSIIEPMPSKQWFLKMERLAKLAIKAIKNKETIIYPKKWEHVLLDRLKNERDWNISRQLWWGHQIPIWFHEPKCVPKKGHESEIVKCKEFVFALKEPECKFCKAKFVQSADVLDTWFSSALWPFATLGWPQKTDDLKKYYPTDFITSARDILNIWIAKMIFSGIEFMNKSPFKTAHIHATVLNKEGKRMSKSLSTG
ncbi:MAG: valine--tRNA ligase, partial [Patescibacteria group bacterium]